MPSPPITSQSGAEATSCQSILDLFFGAGNATADNFNASGTCVLAGPPGTGYCPVAVATSTPTPFPTPMNPYKLVMNDPMTDPPNKAWAAEAIRRLRVANFCGFDRCKEIMARLDTLPVIPATVTPLPNTPTITTTPTVTNTPTSIPTLTPHNAYAIIYPQDGDTLAAHNPDDGLQIDCTVGFSCTGTDLSFPQFNVLKLSLWTPSVTATRTITATPTATAVFTDTATYTPTATITQTPTSTPASWNITTQLFTSSGTAGNQVVILCDATSGNVTITLPAAAGVTGRSYYIKKIDSSGNKCIVDGNASETIDGQTTQDLTFQYTAIQVVCDGTKWHIL